jgi:superfamily I DNA/RNA helicase
MGDSGIILSPKQQIIIEATGNCVVNACPGSGKTFSVAARIAHLLKTKEFHHQGIAAISFTNTAWEEINKKLKEDFQIDVPIRYPHFLGTIDSFINKYVFLPYGHLLMGCSQRPDFVGGNSHQKISWENPRRYIFPGGKKTCIYIDPDELFDKMSFDREGKPISIANPQDFHFSWDNIYKIDKNYIKKVQDVVDNKWTRFGEGKVCQADANYFAYRLLNEFPLIKRNIANRFPYLIIDEAQDTTDVQMEIINMLSQHTKEIMLIGDPDQAIFEWNHAKPSLFEDKIIEWNSEIKLDENRRSSQNICNCANAFLGKVKSIPFECEKVKNYPFVPVLKEFDHENTSNIAKIKNDFLALCKKEGIEEKDIAIIYRSNSFGEHFGKSTSRPEAQPWIVGKYFVRDLVQGKYLYENGDSKKGFKYMEHGFHKASTQKPYLENNYIKTQIEKKGFAKYRGELFEFIDLLPTCKGKDLNTWITETKANLNGKHTFDLEINSTLGRHPIDYYFGDSDLPKDETKYHVGSIHSVKGETYEAVLLFIKKDSGCRTHYANIFNKYESQLTVDEKEELRIIYVGLTRARKILVVAVPNGCRDIWKDKLKLE